jgi:hypothetical protein
VIVSRYLPAVCLMLALVLVPTIMHSYAGVVAADERTTATIATSLAGFASVPGRRDAGWGTREFASADWIDRTYTSGSDALTLTVARSYDLKRLYHHPELAIAHGVSLPKHEIRRFAGQPRIPVHVLLPDTGDGFVVYVLHCDDQFIEDPLSFQLRTAGSLLVSPRKAMTLFFLRAPRGPNGDDALGRASALLFAAIESFGASGRAG